MKPGSTKSNTLVRLVVGWWILLFYIGAFSPIGMLTGAILGTLDPDHHALIQPGVDGIRLVLHHEGSCATHKHHGMARALTIFAQPASAIDPDHVVQFAGGNSILTSEAKIVCGEDAVDDHHVTQFDYPLHQACLVARSLPSTGPPPDTVGNLLNVRFTVLLI